MILPKSLTSSSGFGGNEVGITPAAGFALKRSVNNFLKLLQNYLQVGTVITPLLQLG
jgi:hypothetical protein